MSASSTDKSQTQGRAGAVRWLAPLCLALGFTGLGAWLAAERAAHPGAVLVVEESAADFGERWAASRFEWTVPIRNPSGVAIPVQAVHTSCSCLKAEPESFVVPAHDTVRLTLTLDLASKGASHADHVPYHEEFTLVLGGGIPAVQSFHVRGTVRFPLRREVSVLTVVRGTIDSVVPLTATEALSGVDARIEAMPLAGAVTDPSVTSEPSTSATKPVDHHFDKLSVSVQPDPGDPMRWRLTLRGHATRCGSFQVPVIVRPKAVDETLVFPEMSWILRGLIMSPVEVFPEDIDFRTVAPDANVREIVSLRRRDGRPCRIQEVRCPPGLVAVAAATDDPLVARLQVDATFKTSGVQQTAIEVVIQDGGDDPEVVQIPVRAYVDRDAAPRRSATGTDRPSTHESATHRSASQVGEPE